MDVRVVCAPPTSSCGEKDYVRVHTCADPSDDTVTLATIERVVDKAKEGARIAKRVKTLIVRQRMSQDAALVLATSYAERKHIPVVFADAVPEQWRRDNGDSGRTAFR
jgi:hypothetical protein